MSWAFALTEPNPGYCGSHSSELHYLMDEWAFVLTEPNPGYRQSHTRELHQPMDELDVCLDLTYPWASSVAPIRIQPIHGSAGVFPHLL
jgi:hypothetical protein